MTDNKYDDLEKLFRSRLKNEAPADNQWNVPSMGVLDAALDQLEEKEEPKKRFAIWWLGGILALVMFASAYLFTSQKIDKLKAEISELKVAEEHVEASQVSEVKQILEIPTKENILDDHLDNQSVVNDQSVKNNSIGTGSTNQKTVSSSSGKSIPNSRSNSNSSLFASPSKTSVSNSIKDKITQINKASANARYIPAVIFNKKASNEIAEIDNKHKRTSEAFARVKALSLKELIYNDSKQNLNTRVWDELEHKTARRSPEFYVFGGLNISSIRMTNVENSAFSLINYDKNYLGYQLGAGLKYPISDRWSFKAFSSINRLNNKSQFCESMMYDESKEAFDGSGNLFYESDLYIESPMGGYATTARFALEDGQLAQDDVMKNKTDVNEVFHILNVSFGLEYEAIRIKRFGLFIQGGFGVNYLWRLDQNMKTELSFEDEMLMNKSFESSTLEHTQKLYLSAFANVGARFQVNENFGIELLSGFNRGLSSMRQSDTPNQPNTYLNNIPVNLSLNYKF